MGILNSAKKIDVPTEHWDRLFAPSACLVMITTVDDAGRVNAASFGTCVRTDTSYGTGSSRRITAATRTRTVSWRLIKRCKST